MMISFRRDYRLGTGELRWLDTGPDDVLSWQVGRVQVVMNLSDSGYSVSLDNVVLESVQDSYSNGVVAPETTIWCEVSADEGP